MAWRKVLWLVSLGAVLLVSGCDPSQRAGEEEDENIQIGRSYARDGAYADAEKAFHRALQNHPDSVTAHKELGILYLEHLKDWTGALYHFDRYSRLRPRTHPDVMKGDVITQLMDVCRQEIAKQVPLGDITVDLQRQITSLIRSNESLRAEVNTLREQLGQRSTPATPQTHRSPSVELSRTTPDPVPERAQTVQVVSNPVPALSSVSATRPRTHTIRAGETFYSVGRLYNLNPREIMEANPRLDARSLRVGQVIVLPGQ